MLQNSSEAFVDSICKHSFLSLWSWPNPVGKDPSKELCDILVVCDPYILVFSVKDITHKPTDNPEIGYKRWIKKAIDDSVKQLNGACKWISMVQTVLANDSQLVVQLPPCDRRKVFRIAIAFGSQGLIPFLSGNYGGEIVHVYNEESFEPLFRELDTISDLVAYLQAKEELFARSPQHQNGFTELDLLGTYLYNERSFDHLGNLDYVMSGVWGFYLTHESVIAKKAADVDSYTWDRLIEKVASEILDNHQIDMSLFTQAEAVTRYMALETRFSRRCLSIGVLGFANYESRKVNRARVISSPTQGVIYIFLNSFADESDEQVRVEIEQRSFLRWVLHSAEVIVICLAFRWNEHLNAYRLVVGKFEFGSPSDDDLRIASELQRRTGFFKEARFSEQISDEYPQ